jgi:predicted nucleotidyltransferase
MIQPTIIDRAVDLIVAHYAPEEIFIVGSYSTGTARAGSDLDPTLPSESVTARSSFCSRRS